MIALDHVSRSFSMPGGRQRAVVADVAFDVRPGEFVALIGPSGCGKSTLFNIIAGLDRPSRGRVLVGGEDVTGTISHTGYMPQKDLLFPWRDVLGNTAIGLEIQGLSKRAARERAGALFEQFGLDGFETADPFELSGGMRQRAALLRTVVQQREVLLLDEPFGALDSLTRSEMQAWLQEMWITHTWTAILSTHDIREAIILADRVVVLGARPTRVALELEIDLPRPRGIETLADPRFIAYESTLTRALHDESRKQREVQREAVPRRRRR